MDTSLIPVVTSVVAALAAICAALISAHFQAKTARETNDARKKIEEIARLKQELASTYAELLAFCELETIAAESKAVADGKSAKTIKTELRDEVEKRGFRRPSSQRVKWEQRAKELS